MESDPAKKAEVDKKVMLTPEMSKWMDELAAAFAKSPENFYVGVLALGMVSYSRGMPFTDALNKIGAEMLGTFKMIDAVAKGAKSHGTDPKNN